MLKLKQKNLRLMTELNKKETETESMLIMR
jgi:hypothetical protein